MRDGNSHIQTLVSLFNSNLFNIIKVHLMRHAHRSRIIECTSHLVCRHMPRVLCVAKAHKPKGGIGKIRISSLPRIVIHFRLCWASGTHCKYVHEIVERPPKFASDTANTRPAPIGPRGVAFASCTSRLCVFIWSAFKSCC